MRLARVLPRREPLRRRRRLEGLRRRPGRCQAARLARLGLERREGPRGLQLPEAWPAAATRHSQGRHAKIGGRGGGGAAGEVTAERGASKGLVGRSCPPARSTKPTALRPPGEVGAPCALRARRRPTSSLRSSRCSDRRGVAPSPRRSRVGIAATRRPRCGPQQRHTRREAASGPQAQWPTLEDRRDVGADQASRGDPRDGSEMYCASPMCTCGRAAPTRCVSGARWRGGS